MPSDVPLCDWGTRVWLAEDRDVCDRTVTTRVRINDPAGVLAFSTARGIVLGVCGEHRAVLQSPGAGVVREGVLLAPGDVVRPARRPRGLLARARDALRRFVWRSS